MVECQLPKLDVAGSTPVSRSITSTVYNLPSQRQGLLNNAYCLKPLIQCDDGV